MKERLLTPVEPDDRDFDLIEEIIRKLFREEIYFPLIKALDTDEFIFNVLHNAQDDLLRAIRTGRVRFYRGHFTGRFDSAVSRELRRLGAVWDRRHGSWKIPHRILPIEVSTAISVSEDRFKQTVQKISDRLGKILPDEVAKRLDIGSVFDDALWKMDKKIKKSLGNMTVAPKLTSAGVKRLNEEYIQDTQRAISDFTKKETEKLREFVQKRATAGFRYDSLIKEIQDSYDVSAQKAKFLARQETKLMISKFKEIRYQEAGSTEYIWKTVVGSPAHPVRPTHKALAGTRHRWDTPPISDTRGSRNHPGQDYGCRCYAQPIIKF